MVARPSGSGSEACLFLRGHVVIVVKTDPCPSWAARYVQSRDRQQA